MTARRKKRRAFKDSEREGERGETNRWSPGNRKMKSVDRTEKKKKNHNWNDTNKIPERVNTKGARKESSRRLMLLPETQASRRDRQTRPMLRRGGSHAQDIARERQQGPPQKRTRTPRRRSEGWNV